MWPCNIAVSTFSTYPLQWILGSVFSDFVVFYVDGRNGNVWVWVCVSEVHLPVCVSVVDCRRGQSLVVHAINEGRQAARQVDLDLMGHTSLASTGGVVTSTRTVEDLWSRPVQYDIDTA